MTPERWQQVKGVLHQALELAPDARSAFLDSACSTDHSLRREVESLLSSSDEVRSSFLQSPPVPESTLIPGTQLGPYEIVSLIGAGGMGEVYRAHDSRLGRDVAIKVLPHIFSADDDRLRRFEQEARATAALNHPNILAVHDVGAAEQSPYVVSELLEGETLRNRLKGGPLPVHKAIDLALQAASGLGAAHGRGIVHRDLKPENLFVTTDGRIKILDFGLAKLTQPKVSAAATMPTFEHRTQAGVLMGTVGYMSPEQVRGQATDNRSDIFAFGAILYEMLSGKFAFQRDTLADTMSAILSDDPADLLASNRGIPRVLDRVVGRCLEKKPDERFQSVHDVAFALQAISDVAMEPTSAYRRLTRKKVLVAAGFLLAMLVAGALYYRSRSAVQLTENDTIVLADFANSTGDAVFDDTLKLALRVALNQSPFLHLVSDAKIGTTLKLMTRPANTPLIPEVAREVCQRTGSKAYIAGAIAALGSEYVLGLKAVNCQSGETLANDQATAVAKGEVLSALGDAAAKLRGRLGESLVTLQKFDVRLAAHTTSSLEALKAHSLAFKAGHGGDYAAHLAYELRAIQLDPNFAMAYLGAGIDYRNLNELERASEYFTKAFLSRDHISEREKLYIAAAYYTNVSGELDKAAEALQQEVASFRDEVAYNNLGLVHAEQGQYEKAVEETRQALRLDPDRVLFYGNLGNVLLALQRFDEARHTVETGLARRKDDYHLHEELYALAFLVGDSRAIIEQRSWFEGNPDYENYGLSLESNTEAYTGHLRKARELAQRAVESALHTDNKENAALCYGNDALREAAFGNAARARRSAGEALKTASASQGVEIEAALALGMASDAGRAGSLAQDLAKRFPLDTQVQSIWLPTIDAQLALLKKNPSAAINRLKAAAPVELASIPFSDNGSCLHPVYVRGEAYLAAGQGSAAAGEFQKILDHSGIVWNCWTGAVARLGLARANALEARTAQGAEADAARARALAAYRDFFSLWKDADPDIPILVAAKSEYAKLQ